MSDAIVISEDEVAALLQCSVATVRRRARNGDIPSFKVGWLRRYRRSAILEHIARAEKAETSGGRARSGATVTPIGGAR